MDKQCEAMVTIDTWHDARCRNKAKIEVEGKWYCGIHNPIRLKEVADKKAIEYHKGDCPQCGIHPKPYHKYCPWCGAKLKGGMK